ncbi:IS3 family transposase [Agathobaculum desmolans]|uniref:IS3 family transposase n=1 Tax=Agathobaculum desmolans TaxID=39484 RepID=UPI0039C9D8A5
MNSIPIALSLTIHLFYCRSWSGVSLDDFIQKLNAYIHWYNHKRIKLSLGGLSPLEYRHKLGLFA